MTRSDLAEIEALLERVVRRVIFEEVMTFSSPRPLAQPSTKQQRIDLEYQQDVEKALARIERKAQRTKR